MKCNQARQLVMDFCESELSGHLLDQFKLHLETCPKCRQEVRAVQRTLKILKEVEPTSPPSGFWEDYLVGVRSKIKVQKRRRWVRRLVPSLGTAAAVILLAVLLLTGREKERELPSPLWLSEQESIDYIVYLGSSVAESVDVVQVLAEKLLSSNEMEALESLYYPSEKITEQIAQMGEELELAYEAYYAPWKGGE